MKGIRVRQDGKYIAIWCKGCRHIHGWLPLKVGDREDGWVWNEQTKTLTPSVRHFTPADAEEGIPEQTQCHYNITNGRILFHGDSAAHSLRGEHDMDEEPPPNYGGAEHMGFAPSRESAP